MSKTYDLAKSNLKTLLVVLGQITPVPEIKMSCCYRYEVQRGDVMTIPTDSPRLYISNRKSNVR